ncbi:hypothetical protein QSH50_001700 [Xanthomonas arboricola pv. pruni]|uniref:hypothetical protein n=1 Tax=Xanthomonas arboricola TaxID=56448 RepID=UPI000F88800B|nr:hypothetical protein [Xanthomonas arboricola]MDN0269131.1 hypothetical protein [Xanthomonas arboricola pv. pruni]RST73590.1 hypothetical protein EJL05_22470 [Xanthomonas arboricola pv. pruni]
MISEKTVELNLTTEFINWLSHQHNTLYFALGPTQAQEAQWGFDAGVFGNSTGALIQYKRAYVNGSVWEWRLNRTKAKDQLFRLQQLEAAGHAVFYAFPYFHTLSQLQTNRRRLLLHTFWFKPSQIVPSGGPNGHHEVRYDSTTKKCSVHSEEGIEMPPPMSLGEVISAFDNPENNLAALAEAFNLIVVGPEDTLIERQEEHDNSALSGICIVGRGDA